MLYCSLVVPYMSYCVEVWGNTFKTHLKPIFILQKRIIRIIQRKAYHEPSNALFINLNTLKFWDIVKLQTLLVPYKAHHNLLPHSLQELFKIQESKYKLRNAGAFRHKKARLKPQEHCTSVIGVQLWNKCEKDLRNCKPICAFKKMYKFKTIDGYKNIL